MIIGQNGSECVLLDNLNLIATFSPIDSGAESRDASANDDNLPGWLSHAHHPTFRSLTKFRSRRAHVVDQDQLDDDDRIADRRRWPGNVDIGHARFVR